MVSPKGWGIKKPGIIVMCVNTVGHTIFLIWLFPMLLYTYLTHHGPIKGEVVVTRYGVSVNRWFNTDLLEALFIEHFIPNTISSCSQHSLPATGDQIRLGTLNHLSNLVLAVWSLPHNTLHYLVTYIMKLCTRSTCPHWSYTHDACGYVETISHTMKWRYVIVIP